MWAYPYISYTNNRRLFTIMFLIAMVSFACEKPRRAKRISLAQKRRMAIDSLAHFSALPEVVPYPSDNPPSPEKINLGKLLFFDPILSGNRDVACATCHHPSNGFAESLDISIGVNGRGFGSKRHFHEPNDIPFTKRNSPTVINTAFNGMANEKLYTPEHAPMFWDLRAKSLEDQSLEPLKALEEMRGRNYGETEIIPEVIKRLRNIATYRQLFRKAFPDEPTITADKLAKAIATYERTLVTNHSRFDQYMRGDMDAISISEKEGFEQFIQSGCGNCHNGPMFSDYKMHVLGVPLNPKLDQPDKGIDSSFAFRTPSLRNTRFTAPFMHNGSFPSLKRVLEFYEDISFGKIRNPYLEKDQLDPLVKMIDIRVKDMNSIISFLNTLNDNRFDRSEPESVPSGLPVGGNIK